jgi:hypothetical protein
MARAEGKRVPSKKPRVAAPPSVSPRAPLANDRRARPAQRAADTQKQRAAEPVVKRARAAAKDPTSRSKAARRQKQALSPRVEAESVMIVDASPPLAQRSGDGANAGARVMELHWGDDPIAPAEDDGIVRRWAKRGDTLLRHLAEHGAARHEYRADLRDGRFVWIDPEGRVSAECEARVICRYAPTTSELVMAWRDPMTRSSAVARIDGVPAERDDVDEESAWRVAMEAAEVARAEYLYRVTTPDAWYFLALSRLSFTPGRSSFFPSTPVGLVLRGLAETRRAVESRAEPTEIVRERVARLGRSLLHEAEYAYRGTDWVARLARTGRRLVTMADRLPRSSFKSVAAGIVADEWLDREATIELAEALALLEDEWALFG